MSKSSKEVVVKDEPDHEHLPQLHGDDLQVSQDSNGNVTYTAGKNHHTIIRKAKEYRIRPGDSITFTPQTKLERERPVKPLPLNKALSDPSRQLPSTESLKRMLEDDDSRWYKSKKGRSFSPDPPRNRFIHDENDDEEDCKPSGSSVKKESSRETRVYVPSTQSPSSRRHFTKELVLDKNRELKHMKEKCSVCNTVASCLSPLCPQIQTASDEEDPTAEPDCQNYEVHRMFFCRECLATQRICLICSQPIEQVAVIAYFV